MLFACLLRNVYILRDQNDFSALNGHEISYMGHDIDFDLPKPIDFRNGFLDCGGNKITAATQIFGILNHAVFKNCTFELQKQFAQTVTTTTMINVTLLVDEPDGCRTYIYTSHFRGVVIRTVSQFAASLASSNLTGCSLALTAGRSDTNQTLFAKIEQCTMQNSFFNVTVSVSKSVSVAALTFDSLNLTLLKSRFITNITASGDQEASESEPALSGCVLEVSKVLQVTDCDFLTSVRATGQFASVSGIVDQASSTALVTMSNLSSYLALSDDFKDGRLFGTFLMVGNVISNAYTKIMTLERITTFSYYYLKQTTNELVPSLKISASGFVCTMSYAPGFLADCFMFGSIYIEAAYTKQARVGGCIADGQGNSPTTLAVKNLVFSGDIHLSQPSLYEGSGTALGGLFGKMRNCKISNSQFHGNVTLVRTQTTPTYVGAVLGLKDSGITVEFCSAFANVTVQLQDASGSVAVGCVAGEANFLYNSFARCNLTIAHGKGDTTAVSGGVLVGSLQSALENCSAEGVLLLSIAENANVSGFVGGIVGYVSDGAVVRNVAIQGKMTVPNGFLVIATAFGNIENATASNVVVAIDVIGESAFVYKQTGVAPNFTNVFVDCEKIGNAGQPLFCRTDLTTGGAVAALGDAFAWNAAYSSGYPYLAALPVTDASQKYVLPDSGNFSAPAYYIDDAGLPFPKVDFQPCRGVCYGNYSSPVTRVCDDAFEYCVDVDRAVREFPSESCLTNNAVCGSGASYCTSEAEMLPLDATTEYACQKACPGCHNGYCNQSVCVCDVYNAAANATCAPKCDADEPLCFADNALICNLNNTKCIPIPSCATLPCLHGVCEALPIAHCVCAYPWAGEACDVCEGFGASCVLTPEQCAEKACHGHGKCVGAYDNFECECDAHFDIYYSCSKCEAYMQVINGQCACGRAGNVCAEGLFCASGSCYLDCMGLDYHCADCDKDKMNLCGACAEGFDLKKGACVVLKSAPVAAIVGIVIGSVAVLAAACGLAAFFVMKRKKGGYGLLKDASKDAAKDAVKDSARAQHRSLELKAVQSAGADLTAQQAYTE